MTEIIIVVAVFVVFVTFSRLFLVTKDVLQIKSLLFMVVQAERLLYTWWWCFIWPVVQDYQYLDLKPLLKPI
jgi:flotillin